LDREPESPFREKVCHVVRLFDLDESRRMIGWNRFMNLTNSKNRFPPIDGRSVFYGFAHLSIPNLENHAAKGEKQPIEPGAS
jgi:hypothetical protein